MISIYTRSNNPFTKEFLKWLAKKILRRYSGPDAVIDSLKRGLDALGVDYEINPLLVRNGSVVHVLSGISILKKAIRLKKDGRIKMLIAGPNMVILPYANERILASPAIDTVLTVSEWTRIFYSEHLPEIKPKIKVWPAGVRIPDLASDKTERDLCIVYKKSVAPVIFEKVMHELEQRGISPVVFAYSDFDQKKYFSCLKRAKYMIYLQEVESQGIALQEAWAHDVPTLVWNKEYFTYPTGEKVTGNIAAPFLTEECGSFFGDEMDFAKKFDEFLQKLPDFAARKYCAENLSDEASARIYVSIVESIT